MKSNLAYQEREILTKEMVAPQTFLIRLKGDLYFRPGQFIQAAVDHFGEATFAPCSDPRENKFFEICVRNCGNTSNAITQLLPGDKLKIRGPYGNGWPEKLSHQDIILIAGGMGLVPLRPLIFELLHKKLSFNKIRLFAGFKSTEQILFEKDLVGLRKKIGVEVAVEYLTEKSWVKKGMITDSIRGSHFKHDNSIVMICGPEVMVPYCNEELFAKGIAENQIYVSFERRMQCGIGVCQHCNIGKYLVCKDGPVFRWDKIKNEIGK